MRPAMIAFPSSQNGAYAATFSSLNSGDEPLRMNSPGASRSSIISASGSIHGPPRASRVTARRLAAAASLVLPHSQRGTFIARRRCPRASCRREAAERLADHLAAACEDHLLPVAGLGIVAVLDRSLDALGLRVAPVDVGVAVQPVILAQRGEPGGGRIGAVLERHVDHAV